jgi:hypothetical protein
MKKILCALILVFSYSSADMPIKQIVRPGEIPDDQMQLPDFLEKKFEALGYHQRFAEQSACQSEDKRSKFDEVIEDIYLRRAQIVHLYNFTSEFGKQKNIVIANRLNYLCAVIEHKLQELEKMKCSAQ